MEKFTKKILIDRVGFSARVLVVGIILSIVFFLLFLDSFRTYHSEISILINTKSQVAAKQQAQIVSNIAELPKTLAFYDRMLAKNTDMRDVAVGLSAQKRKTIWNEMLTVERASFDASVLKIGITTSREADSVQLANKTVRSLFDTTAFYYNIKDDVDLRIIDGPITRVYVSNWFWLFVLSVVLGFATSAFLQYLVFGSKKISFSKPNFLKRNSFFDFKKNSEMPVEDELEMLNNLYRAQQAEEAFVFEQNIASVSDSDKKFQEIKKITKKLEPGKYPNFPEMPTAQKHTSNAPDNLPIADDSYLAQYAAPKEPEQMQSMQAEKETILEDTLVAPSEPTSEELKKRLNELLKGKI